MRQIIAIGLFLSLTSTAFGQFQALFDATDSFYDKHVSNGLVNYAAIAEKPAPLNQLIEKYQDASTLELTKENYIALVTNAYNLLVIKSLVDEYPVDSPQSISSFFDRKTFTFFGEKMSLNELEKENLFKKYFDERYHFVLVCGAKGCPPLQQKAYRPSTLEQQFEETTQKALNDTYFIRAEGKKVLISEIFNWYAADFPRGRNGVISYLNKYRTSPIDEDAGIGYYTYDWSINDLENSNLGNQVGASEGTRNLQALTPSILFSKGQFEIKNFANLYYQTDNFDSEGTRQPINAKNSFFTNTVQFTYGINTKLNIGFDTYIRASRLDSDPNSSAFRTLSFRNEPFVSRGAVSHIGPKIKFAPFNKLRNLSFQAVVLFPLENNLFGNDPQRLFLDFNGVQTFFQAFYDKQINRSFSIFGQIDFIRAHGGEQGITRLPMKAFLSYFPTNKITLYTFAEYGPSLNEAYRGDYFTQVGLGGKYQIVPGFEIELSGSTFPIGVNNGAGSTINLGLRFVR